MSNKIRSDLKPNTFEYEMQPLITQNGFREYDARWLFGKELNLMGVQMVGLGLGTYFHELGIKPKVAAGHDYRSYEMSIKQALIIGLMQAGCEVVDIGLGTTPMGVLRAIRTRLPRPCDGHRQPQRERLDRR